MKTYPISGISKKICCREQKIAYNICFNASVGWSWIVEDRGGTDETAKAWYMEKIVSNQIDSVSIAINKSLVYDLVSRYLLQYIRNEFIAADYKTIGDFFRIEEA